MRIWAMVRLLRPVNVVLFMVGVAVGGVLADGASVLLSADGARLAWAALSAACIGGAANSLNDVFDLDIDRINRPDRPLPSGLVSIKAARLVWAVGSVVGLGLAVLVSLTHLAMAAGAVVLLLAYNARLKRTVLLGNLVVAFVVALALVYGGMAVGTLGAVLVGAGFAAMTTLARELIKDIEDVTGDATSGARTLPLVAGTGVAIVLIVAVLVLTMVLTPLPYLFLGYSGLFLLLVLITDGLLLRTLSLMLHTPLEAAHAGTLLKGAMVCGLAALAAA